MRATRCSCGQVVELGMVFCVCGAQMSSWPPGQARPVSGRWLQLPLLALSGGKTMPVVGESFRPEPVERVAGGRTEEGAKYRWHTAQLVQEDTNPHDPGNAVMVLIGGAQVGYIPAESCSLVRAVMARHPSEPFTMRALVTGGWLRWDDGPRNFGVELDADSTFRRFNRDTDPFLPGSYHVTITRLTPEVENAAARTLSPVVHLAPAGDGIVVGSDGAWWGSLTKAMVARYRPFLHAVGSAGLPVTAQAVLTMKEGKRRAHVMLPSEYTCGLLMETASR